MSKKLDGILAVFNKTGRQLEAFIAKSDNDVDRFEEDILYLEGSIAEKGISIQEVKAEQDRAASVLENLNAILGK